MGISHFHSKAELNVGLSRAYDSISRWADDKWWWIAEITVCTRRTYTTIGSEKLPFDQVNCWIKITWSRRLSRVTSLTPSPRIPTVRSHSFNAESPLKASGFLSNPRIWGLAISGYTRLFFKFESRTTPLELYLGNKSFNTPVLASKKFGVKPSL